MGIYLGFLTLFRNEMSLRQDAGYVATIWSQFIIA